MDFGNLVTNLLGQMAFFHLTIGNYVMIGVALVFLYLAIRRGFEPLPPQTAAGQHRRNPSRSG